LFFATSLLYIIPVVTTLSLMYINGTWWFSMGNVLHLEHGLSNGLSLETFSFFLYWLFSTANFFSCVWTGTHWSKFNKVKVLRPTLLICSTLFLLTLVLLRVISSSKRANKSTDEATKHQNALWAWHFIYFFSYFRWHFYFWLFIDTEILSCLKYLEVELLNW
jgi:hypothetical protein